MLLPSKRGAFGILALVSLAAFHLLKFELPVVRDMPFIAFFIVLASIGIYVALKDDDSSIVDRLSIMAMAVAFSILVMAFSPHLGLSSFRLATRTDAWAVFLMLVALIGLVTHGLSRKRHSRDGDT